MVKFFLVLFTVIAAAMAAFELDRRYAIKADKKIHEKVLARIQKLNGMEFEPHKYLQHCENYVEFIYYHSRSCISATSIVRAGEGKRGEAQIFSLQYIPAIGILNPIRLLWGNSRLNRFPESAERVHVFKRKVPDTHVKKDQ